MSKQPPDHGPSIKDDAQYDALREPGDFGTRGRFDARAKNHSLQLWMNTHRYRSLAFVVAGIATAAATAAAVSALRKRK